ncbi:MAG: molecular chaperone TorD family protein [Nitrospirae bacterium]|nr:molecular chaperone TorD family protein [Nitrospirota bacterium]
MMETIMANQSIPQIYLFLSKCFSYPKREFYEAVGGAEAAEELCALIEGLPFEVDFFNGIPSPSLHQDELESEYINTFDMGGGKTLYESDYTGYRDDMCSRDIYEDILRFYEHFDIKLSDKEKDYPDNLSVELEFMAFLSKKEADALEFGKDANPYRLAQRDFLERHLNKWVDKLNERIQKRIKEPFYKGASAFMKEFLRNHLLHLKEVLKRLN